MRSKFSFFRFLPVLPFLCLLAVGLSHTTLAKVSATIILASVEGEVKALSLDENLELTLDESSVGKSVDENFILTTGKNGKAVFLFSNGVLVTLKPNTRLYVRTFVHESFSSKNLPPPGELEEEPSTSHLEIHLDTGDLVVKAPKLKRGSSLKLTSPLGTARIRGTMFQIVVARDPDTGTVSGGVNLISGDIDFTAVSGDTSILASGQGLEVSTGKLGDSSGGVSGELRDLSAKFGPVLAGTGMFPPIVAPPDTVTLPPEGVVAPEALAPTVGYLPREDGWGSIHDIATATFFEIEEAEFSVSSVTFDAIESAVSVDTPTPMLTAPTVPASISGGDMAPPDPFFGGAPKLALKGKATLEWEMGVPYDEPGFTAEDFAGGDLSSATKLVNLPDVLIQGKQTLTYSSSDFRGFENAISRTVDVKITKPVITLVPGHDGGTADGTRVFHEFGNRNAEFGPIRSNSFTDPGFTARSFSDPGNPKGDLDDFVETLPVDGASIVNVDKVGSYEITYNVNDSHVRGIKFQGRFIPIVWAQEVKRTVQVKDLTQPRIEMLPIGEDKVFVEGGTGKKYVDSRAKAIDNFDDTIEIDADPYDVDMMKVGAYSVFYTHSDQEGNKAENNGVERTVNVYDKTPPDLTLFGAPVDFIELKTNYRDPGFLAIDNFDMEIPWEPDPDKRALTNDQRIEVIVKRQTETGEETVDSMDWVMEQKQLGKFKITYRVYDQDAVDRGQGVKDWYKATDIQGLRSPSQFYSEVYRTVFVRGDDNGTNFVFELLGENPITLEVGTDFIDPGVNAFKQLSFNPDVRRDYNATRISGVPNMNVLGTSEIRYRVEDEFGNSKEAIRIINIVDTTAPVVYPNKANGQTNLALEAGVSYSDDGATAIDNYFRPQDLTYDVEYSRVSTPYDEDSSALDLEQISSVGFVDAIDPDIGYGKYQVLYSVTDQSTDINGTGNTGTATRVLKVYDNTAPVGKMLDATQRSSFVSPSEGDTVFDVVGDNENPNKVVFADGKDWALVEDVDEHGREVITAIGFRIEGGDSQFYYHDPGVKFTDNAKGDLVITVQHTKLRPDAGVDEQYEITYQAKDPLLNSSTVLKRIVKIRQGPRVLLNGASTVVVVHYTNQTEEKSYDVANGYIDAGATAQDSGVPPKDISILSSDFPGIMVKYSYEDIDSSKNDGTNPNDLLPLSFIKWNEIVPLGPLGLDGNRTGKYSIEFSVADGFEVSGSPPPNVSPSEVRTVYTVANDGVKPTIRPVAAVSDSPIEDSPIPVWETFVDVNATGYATYIEQGATASKVRHKGITGPVDGPPGFSYQEVQNWDEKDFDPVPEGNPIPSVLGAGTVENGPYYVKYSVKDEFDNIGEAKLKVTVRDRIAPTIPVPESLDIEANASYDDPGFVPSDNYYSLDSLSAKVFFLKQKEDSNESAFKTITYNTDYNWGDSIPHEDIDIPTWDLENYGTFFVRYAPADPSGNYKEYIRKVTVTDRVGPSISLNPTPADSFRSGDSNPIYLLQDLNDSALYEDPGITITDNSWGPDDTPESINVSTVIKKDLSFRKVTVTIDTSNVEISKPGQYEVTYTATDATGNETIENRTVYVLDTVKPNLFASWSEGNGTFNATLNTPFVVAEGGVPYDDDSGQRVRLWNGSDWEANGTLTLEANDAQDGVITSKISRTIGEGIIKNNDIASVPSLIDTSFSSLNTVYEIRYDVSDTADPSIPGDTENAADPLYRRIIVKDTMAPSIQPSSFETTVLVDYKSTANPKVSDPADVENFLVNGFSAVDANNFEPIVNLDWIVDINKTDHSGKVIEGGYVPDEIFPVTRNDDGPGYKITIKVKDSSGNVSAPVVRYLKVGDFTPPTLTMMGKSEIHDFFRFGKNDKANTDIYKILGGPTADEDNRPFVDRNYDASTNPDYDATGFSGGAHRMMLAEYNFTDPGVYAEDENADWALSKGYPDLNGNAVGEGFATVRKSDRVDMDTCSEGPGLIHVYSFMENVPEKKIKDWQDLMKGGDYGYISPAKVPDVEGAGFDFNSSNKTTDLTNFNLTQITIEYRVKDSWDNYSAIATRLVYFYESRQFGNYAFYATPITDAANLPFEDYDNNGSTGNPVLSGARKDTDGDGVSDFWEFALGTDPERVGVPGDPDKYTPDFADPLTFRYTSESPTDLSKPTLESNLGRMNAAGRLTNVRGIQDFKATSDL